MGAANLNASVPNDTLTIELFQQRTSLFGMGIEIRYGRSYSECERFLHSWIGKASDAVGRYRHPYRRGVEYALKPFPLPAQGFGSLPQGERGFIDLPLDLFVSPY
jgi:hypothetical protein